MAVVVDPALDIRVEHPRQIIERLIAPSMECPPPDRLPYCLACLRTCGGQKRNTELASAPDGGPRPKLVAEEVERLDRIVPTPVGIPAVDELCLLRYERVGRRYASDLTDAEWRLIEPYMPAVKRLGRPRGTDVRDVVDAISYIARTGCQWRLLPKDFPPFPTVRRCWR